MWRMLRNRLSRRHFRVSPSLLCLTPPLQLSQVQQKTKKKGCRSSIWSMSRREVSQIQNTYNIYYTYVNSKSFEAGACWGMLGVHIKSIIELLLKHFSTHYGGITPEEGKEDIDASSEGKDTKMQCLNDADCFSEMFLNVWSCDDIFCHSCKTLRSTSRIFWEYGCMWPKDQRRCNAIGLSWCCLVWGWFHRYVKLQVHRNGGTIGETRRVTGLVVDTTGHSGGWWVALFPAMHKLI